MNLCTACHARPHHARGYCATCYIRAVRAGLIEPRKRVARCRYCGDPVHAKGYCLMHYKRLYRHGDANIVNPPGRTRGLCERCGAPHYARGLCKTHYQWERRHA